MPDNTDLRVKPLIVAGQMPEVEARRMLVMLDDVDKLCGIYRVCLTDPELVRGLTITIAKATGFSPGRAETLAYNLVGEIAAFGGEES